MAPPRPRSLSLETTRAVGQLNKSYYRKLMPGWRCDVRERLVESLHEEVPHLVRLQRTWRTKFRDQYFVKTSLLGTHTFFMIFIPIWAWFGFPEVARGLLYVLAAGGYVTSVLKDAFCVPRPFSPPVQRLSVGSHALEYGFPSTHSSNALSMALFFGELLLRRNREGSWMVNALGVVGLVFFAWSITFGRLYTGMHSKMDVRVGASLGVMVWLLTWLGEGPLERLVSGTRLTGTLIIIPLLLLLVTFHPQPAENCPCFEDAIAFLSVFGGILLGVAWNPTRHADHTVGWIWGDWKDVGVWAGAVGAKLFIGISTILVWRIVAKWLCHQALPPVFRFFAPIISLPRRYYIAATEYGSYPSQTSLNPVPSILDLPSLAEDAELSSPTIANNDHSKSSSLLSPTTTQPGMGTRSLSSDKFLRSRAKRINGDGGGGGGLVSSNKSFTTSTSSSRSSSLDSITSPTSPNGTSSPSSTLPNPPTSPTDLVKNDGSASLPHSRPTYVPLVPSSSSKALKEGTGGGETEEGETPLHLDADVLTKIVVYGGIGWIATVTLPWTFEVVGLSVWRGSGAVVKEGLLGLVP